MLQGPFSYQWELNGYPILGATNNPLLLINIGPSEAGNYSVIVQNAFGTVIKL